MPMHLEARHHSDPNIDARHVTHNAATSLFLSNDPGPNCSRTPILTPAATAQAISPCDPQNPSCTANGTAVLKKAYIPFNGPQTAWHWRTDCRVQFKEMSHTTTGSQENHVFGNPHTSSSRSAISSSRSSASAARSCVEAQLDARA